MGSNKRLLIQIMAVFPCYRKTLQFIHPMHSYMLPTQTTKGLQFKEVMSPGISAFLVA
jgi:hypothetical protein